MKDEQTNCLFALGVQNWQLICCPKLLFYFFNAIMGVVYSIYNLLQIY